MQRQPKSVNKQIKLTSKTCDRKKLMRAFGDKNSIWQYFRWLKIGLNMWPCHTFSWEGGVTHVDLWWQQLMIFLEPLQELGGNNLVKNLWPKESLDLCSGHTVRWEGGSRSWRFVWQWIICLEPLLTKTGWK